MDERTRAISFANCYFALVDGLASGLDSHLAEDVVLDWFGRTVRGRRNVAAFMEAHKVNSRHVFKSIAPSSGVSYEGKSSNREKDFSYRSLDDRETSKIDVNTDNGDDCAKNRAEINETDFLETDVSAAVDVTRDLNQNEIDPMKTAAANEEDADVFHYLSEGDLSNLFKLKISETDTEEIERSINRIKLEEEVAPTVKAVERERGQGDRPVIVETGTVKYVEAQGEIELSRKAWKQDAWNSYVSATSNLQRWRRPCKLQIAYSTLTERPASESSHKRKNSGTYFSPPKARLLSLEEINEISDRLVPNKNDFNGFLKDFDFFKDRKGFLANLETELAAKDPLTPLIVPRYIEDKLVFSKPRIDVDDRNDLNKTEFVFNYQIHLIIYESKSKAKVRFARESEEKKVTEEVSEAKDQ
ncbi:uncharacterized protein LOC116427896 [Nomia melanderi]|uniref:uncharacterized protein LOC116427896 n=1 Tax=Nomia melanderi TaxID=2448451 RepID=UPI0013042C9B|nr:uncharacterized protein LOC116427896 [Nomia melanderi]